MPTRGFKITFEGFVGRRQRRGLKRCLVKVAHVTQFARQQLDLKVAEPQGEKVGRQVRVDVRFPLVESFQGGGQHVVSTRQIPQHACPGRFGLHRPALRQQRLAAVGHNKQVARAIRGRRCGRQPAGNRLGTCQQQWVPQRRPCREQLFSIRLLPPEIEILQTLARQQDDQLIELHGG